MFSLSASIIGLTLIAQASAHVSLINIYGSNDVIGHAFGVDVHGRYPRVKGARGDAGGDSGIFQTGTNNPSPACGRTPELGPLDIPAWLDQSEAFGLPAAYPNMSVVIEAFQVNRDGGGPMSCEYNEDATGTSWKPMFMTLNQAGNSGIQNQVRTNETVVTNFPEGAKCTGGWTQTACIVRCRTGVNKRFGGCFAVKLYGAKSKEDLTVISEIAANSLATTDPGSDSGNALSDNQLNLIAQQVLIQMKKDGLVLSASGKCASSNLDIHTLSHISQAIQLGQTQKATSLAAVVSNHGNHPDIINAVKFASHNANFDASDAEDVHVNGMNRDLAYASPMPTSNHPILATSPASHHPILAASDASDKQPHNLTSEMNYVASTHHSDTASASDKSSATSKSVSSSKKKPRQRCQAEEQNYA